MARPPLEVADVFRAHGAAWRKASAGHVSLAQLKVMSAIETRRRPRSAATSSAARTARTNGSPTTPAGIVTSSEVPGGAARRWLEDREAELLPAPYYHVVFTLPAAIGAVALQNKAAVYDLLFRTAAETLTTIAADLKHLGARIGLTAVLHTWGSALTHHPHAVHVIVPGGGLSPDGSRWLACKPGFFLFVRVLSRLFRRLFLDGLAALHAAGRLVFLGGLEPLADKKSLRRRDPRRCAAPSGWSTPRGRSLGRRLSSPISPATPTASRSRTPGLSRSTTRASRSGGKMVGSTAATGSRP